MPASQRLEDIASSLCYPPALLAAPRELFFCRVQAQVTSLPTPQPTTASSLTTVPPTQPCRGARGTYPLYCLVTRCESVKEGEGSAPRVAVLLTRSAAVPLQAHASLLSSLRPLLAASMHSNSARAQLRDALEAHPAPSEAAALVSCAPPHSPGRMSPAPPSHSPRWQADHLAAWSLPRLCRALSVPSMLQLLTAALLEHRICVHRGASACTLETSTAAALAPLALLHPFTWQGVLVSALPPQLSALLDAPVPFLVGLAAPCEPQHTLPSDDVTHVCLALDRVTFPPGTPRLPGLKSLSRALAHLHGRCAAGDQHAVKALCAAVQAHLELRLGLSAEALKQHAITRVAPCGERTSALLVGSYIESLGSSSARAFAGGLTQTSAFAALCDERL